MYTTSVSLCIGITHFCFFFSMSGYQLKHSDSPIIQLHLNDNTTTKIKNEQYSFHMLFLTVIKHLRKEGHVLFNSALNTFYYGYMVLDIW